MDVSVSLNGQQFDTPADGTHGYRAPPIVTRLTPRAGPASATTHVLVEAHGLGWGVDYRCDLGGLLVPAPAARDAGGFFDEASGVMVVDGDSDDDGDDDIDGAFDASEDFAQDVALRRDGA